MSFLLPAAIGVSGLAGAGANLAGGKKGASAATAAARAQLTAAEDSLGLQRGVYQQIQSNLQPFLDYGSGGIGPLASFLSGPATTPIDTSLPTFDPSAALDPNKLAQTPGYQFTLKQAQLAALGQSAAAGGGRGWNPIGTISAVTAGQAASTWPTVFNALQQQYQTNVNSTLASRTMQLQQYQQIANMLGARVGTGLSASSIGSNVGIQAANTLGSTITGAGAAQASGIVGAANALNQGGIGAANALAGIPQSMLLANAFGGGMGFNNPNTIQVNNDPVASGAVNARVDQLAIQQG